MKPVFVAFATAAAGAAAGDAEASPVGKALELLSSLNEKITNDGKAEFKAHNEYQNWCALTKQQRGFDIDDAKDEVEEARAEYGSSFAASNTAASKIKTLEATITKNQQELGDATRIREQEAKDFATSETELIGTVDTLDRASTILSQQLKDSKEKDASLLQVKINPKDSQALLATLKRVVEAAGLDNADKDRLVALADSEDLSYPEAAAYDKQSHGILEVLEDLKSKAEVALSGSRTREQTSKHNFEKLEQSLKNQLGVGSDELKSTKAAKSQADHKAAAAQDEQQTAKKNMAEAKKNLEEVTGACKSEENDYEDSTANRKLELDALAEATEALKRKMGTAASRLYGASLFEISRGVTSTPEGLDKVEVQDLIRKAAKDDHSTAMAQLSNAVSESIRSGSGDMGKVVDLIENLIAKLKKEAAEDGGHARYCNEELTKAGRKKNSLDLEKEKYESRKDVAQSKVDSLNGHLSKDRSALVELAKEQSEADKIRAEEAEAFTVAKKDLQQGLEGVRVAINVLREFYAARGLAFFQVETVSGQPDLPTFHSKSSAAGNSIVSMLQVVESDLSKGIATEETNENVAIRNYKKLTEDNRYYTTSKTSDVAYKEKSIAGLEKAIRDHSADLATNKAESEASDKYLKEINEACSNAGPTAEEVQAMRENEIKNLKEALELIGSIGKKAGLIQTKHLRGH